jgi:hypothetical protein
MPILRILATTLSAVLLSSCASQTRALEPSELEGKWNLRTLVYREDLGCVVRGVLTIAGRDEGRVCTIEVRETCEVYDRDKFVVALDTCSLDTKGADILLRVNDRKVLSGNRNYLKGAPHKLAR